MSELGRIVFGPGGGGDFGGRQEPRPPAPPSITVLTYLAAHSEVPWSVAQSYAQATARDQGLSGGYATHEDIVSARAKLRVMEARALIQELSQ